MRSRSRSLWLLGVAVLVAVTVLLVACSDDESNDRQAAQAQAQQTQQQGAAEESASASAQDSQADRQPAATAQDDQPEPSGGATAQRGTRSSTIEDPLLAEAVAAFESWADNLTFMEIDFSVGFNLFGLEAQVGASAVYRAEPFGILATLDPSGLLAAASELADDESISPDELGMLFVLFTEDGGYLSMTGLDGWVDLQDDVDDTLGGLTLLFGNPASLGDPIGLGQGLGCAELIGGAVTLSRHDGENVWLIECEIDAATLDAATQEALSEMGIELSDAGFETMRLRTAISRETGAPLFIESNIEIVDVFGFGSDQANAEDDAEDGAEGLSSYVNSTGTLRSWNEPIELPTPEPLVDAALLDELGLTDSAQDSGMSPGGDADRPPSELLTADELIGLASDWTNSVDELQMEFVAQAVIDGESRLASTVVRSSRSQGAFETGVVIDDSATFRLLWNRDGIWTSAEDAAAGPVWEPSNPALLGFAGLTVDEFLANPDRINLAPYAELLDLSWLTRTIEGGGPAVYELVIESGPRWPGDDYFDQLVEVLKAEVAELLAENIVVESIEHFSTIITIYGDNGEVASQITTAEFESNAGRVDLVASLDLTTASPIEFSSPGN